MITLLLTLFFSIIIISFLVIVQNLTKKSPSHNWIYYYRYGKQYRRECSVCGSKQIDSLPAYWTPVWSPVEDWPK